MLAETVREYVLEVWTVRYCVVVAPSIPTLSPEISCVFSKGFVWRLAKILSAVSRDIPGIESSTGRGAKLTFIWFLLEYTVK